MYTVHSGQAANVSTTLWLHQQTWSFINLHPTILHREKHKSSLTSRTASFSIYFYFI